MDGAITAKNQSFFQRLGGNIFLAIIFLLPVFFVPSSLIPFQFGKGFFLVVAVFLLVIFFLANVLKNGKVTIPLSLTLLGLGAVFVSYVVSAALSQNQSLSFFGQGFELDTAYLTAVLLLLAILPTLIFKSKPRLFNVYIALLGSFFVVVLFSLIRFLAPNFLSLGIFNGSAGNLIGTWNDLGAYAGFMVTLSLISLVALETKGIWRGVLYIALTLGILFLAIVNFVTMWLIVAAFALVFFLYSLSYAKRRNAASGGEGGTSIKKVSFAPIFVLVLTIVFLLDFSMTRDQAGNRLPGPINTYISTKLNISQIEARPSWGTTFSIGKAALKESPIFGTGPNQFMQQWLLKKPLAVNESVFWNVDFSAGIGTVPTNIITLGLLGLLSFIVFFGLFIFEGLKAVRRLHGDVFAHYLAFSSFGSAIYFWLTAIFYTPTHVIYSLAFLFTGVFVTTMILEGVVKEKHINFGENPGKSFIGSLIVIVLLIASVSGLYIAGKRFAAFTVFNRAVAAYNQNTDLDKLERKVRQTILLEKNDLFYRTLSDLYLARLNLLGQLTPAPSEVADLQSKFRQYLEGAIGSAQEAAKNNPGNYLNQLQLARVYEVVVPLRPKIEGAYEYARDSYLAAIKLNPTSPAIRLAQARLEVINGDNIKAREFITDALKLKTNFTDAIFLLTQIEVSEGNTKKAIEAVNTAAIISPTNPVIFFQLGLLYYNDQNFRKAIEALENAVRLAPDYANAKYFLGLSYDRLGRNFEALKQFEDLLVTNPDNAEVKFILANLQAGRPAFAQVEPPLDNTPEKRKTPPISEKTEKKDAASGSESASGE